MNRTVEIHSAWPATEAIAPRDMADLSRHAAEGWSLFGLENGERVVGVITHRWDNACAWSRKWLMGAAPSEM